MHSDGAIQKFGGKILRLRNDSYWTGSSWEAADILWDGNDGLQTISMFETLLDDPISLYPSLPQEVTTQLITLIEQMESKQYARKDLIRSSFCRSVYNSCSFTST